MMKSTLACAAVAVAVANGNSPSTTLSPLLQEIGEGIEGKATPITRSKGSKDSECVWVTEDTHMAQTGCLTQQRARMSSKEIMESSMTCGLAIFDIGGDDFDFGGLGSGSGSANDTDLDIDFGGLGSGDFDFGGLGSGMGDDTDFDFDEGARRRLSGDVPMPQPFVDGHEARRATCESTEYTNELGETHNCVYREDMEVVGACYTKFYADYLKSEEGTENQACTVHKSEKACLKQKCEWQQVTSIDLNGESEKVDEYQCVGKKMAKRDRACAKFDDAKSCAAYVPKSSEDKSSKDESSKDESSDVESSKDESSEKSSATAIKVSLVAVSVLAAGLLL